MINKVNNLENNVQTAATLPIHSEVREDVFYSDDEGHAQ